MTSIDSGIETSNNSDDNGIAPNENASSDEVSSGPSALATVSNYRIDCHEIKPLDINLPSPPSSWRPFMFSPFASLNDNFSYPHEVDNSLPTSSSGLVVAPPKVVEIKFHPSARLTPGICISPAYCFKKCRKMRSTYATRRFHHSIMLNHFRNCRVGPKMRIAALTNDTIMMKNLLNQGACPNSSDHQGRTPLHLACGRGYTEIVRLLLQHGANPNLRDSVGNTPLHLAAVTNKTVVSLLLNAGVDPSCLDEEGYNPLQLVQTKLHILQSCKSKDSVVIKEEIQNIVSMLLEYLQKHKDSRKNVEALSTFCSRLSLSNTSEQVQDDVKDLLAHLDALSITH